MKQKSVLKSVTAKVLVILMVILTLTSTFALPVSAASSWPSVSSSSYCEFIASRNINVYRYSNLSTRGTSSPAKSYNAYIETGDTCRIIEFNSSFIKLQYPTSSGYKTGFIRRSDLLGISAPSEQITSNGKTDTYKKSGGAYYGYVAKGDLVWNCGTSGNYTAVIYQAKSGNRAYKLGYVPTGNYNSVIKKQSSPASGSFQWPMNGYWTTQSFNSYSNSMAGKGRPYHSGMDIKSSNNNVYAAAYGKVIYKGYSSGNGNHVIIEHSFSGTTVKTLYSHLANFSGCPSVGSIVNKGVKIGTMGSTGNSTGPHLHFAIFAGNSNDPYGYVKYSGSNKMTYNGCTFFNPEYVIKYNKLP